MISEIWLGNLPLGQDLSTDLFVYDDAYSMLGNIENSSSLAVVVFERHALLEGTIAFDINNVSLLVNFQEGGERFHAVFLEFLGKQVACTTTVAFRVHHLDVCVKSGKQFMSNYSTKIKRICLCC